MKRKTKDKLWVLAAAFAAFAGGVLALQLDRGGPRTLALSLCFAALIALALRQSLKHRDKKQD